ncbi:probable cytochrome P450 313a2 [Teleopsis dalmanni]|uniref:probable cytochrome P450 313a2 n=1 Tax=Teleopsis dalmanni TaxID=139649 RepID=UPI0018CED03E|nr:probable cytochrome P450 313a2 [Teleopsis dalmanni]
MFLFSAFNLFYFLCFTLGFILSYSFYTKKQKFQIVAAKLPTANGIPFIGIGYEMIPLKKLFYVLDSYFEKFKSFTFFTWFGTEPFVVTMDPEVIKQVLSSDDFLSKSKFLYTPIDNALHDGIITSSGNKWRHNRKLMNTLFTHNILTKFMPIFNNGTKNAVNKLNEFVSQPEIPIFQILKRIVLQIAIETTMGIEIKDGNKSDEELVNIFNFILENCAQDALYSSVHLGFLTHTLKYRRSKKYIRKVVQELINVKFQDKREIKTEQNSETELPKKSEIFLNQAFAFHERGLFELEDIIIETQTMIAGSFETISTTIYSVLVMLAMHTDVQEKVYEEILHICPDENEELTYEVLQEFHYLDMCLDETLRLMPSIPVIGRNVLVDTKLPNNIHLPKGTQVMIPIFNLHRRKDIWGAQANEFNPENFSQENATKRDPFAYIPFSKGSRNCIGWRYAETALRVLLITLVRNFKFSTSFPYKDLEFVDHLSLRYVVEPKIKISLRE